MERGCGHDVKKWHQHVILYHKTSADFMMNLLCILNAAEFHLSGFYAISEHVCVSQTTLCL